MKSYVEKAYFHQKRKSNSARKTLGLYHTAFSSILVLETEPELKQTTPKFFVIAESVFLTIFSLEYIARVIFAGTKEKLSRVFVED